MFDRQRERFEHEAHIKQYQYNDIKKRSLIAICNQYKNNYTLWKNQNHYIAQAFQDLLEMICSPDNKDEIRKLILMLGLFDSIRAYLESESRDTLYTLLSTPALFRYLHRYNSSSSENWFAEFTIPFFLNFQGKIVKPYCENVKKNSMINIQRTQELVGELNDVYATLMSQIGDYEAPFYNTYVRNSPNLSMKDLVALCGIEWVNRQCNRRFVVATRGVSFEVCK